MSDEFPDVMVDLETTGLDFARTHILQIAAVRFNLAERTVDHNFFDRSLLPAPNRFWDEQTRTWWLKDKKEILNGIMQRMESPKLVLEGLQTFAGRNPVFWAKPTHFDFNFLASYYTQYELANPFGFRDANDMNSFIRARYFPAKPPNLVELVPFEGKIHNALHDCLHQVSTLFKVMELTVSEELSFDTP
jgi:DNA polymerase III alpha subunit (gram-positive type)